MAKFPGNRPANVTVNPESTYSGPKKSVFPGARPTSVTRDPEHEGDTNARKGHFPSNYPYASGVTKDLLRDRDPAQTNNSGYGGQFTPGGNYSYPSQDPEHRQSGDAANLAKPSAVTAITATPSAGQVSVAFTHGAVSGKDYTLKLSPGGKSVTATASPLVITGLADGAYTGTIVGRNQSGSGASAAVASFTVGAIAAPTAVSMVIASNAYDVTWNTPVPSGVTHVVVKLYDAADMATVLATATSQTPAAGTQHLASPAPTTGHSYKAVVSFQGSDNQPHDLTTSAVLAS